jgi:hypothetical protein
MHYSFKMLGCRVQDRITGITGIVESVSFDLYGCVQAVMRSRPTTEKPLEIPEGRWIDVKRLTVLDPTPVMDVPSFDPEIGAAEKPAFNSMPRR